MGQNIPAQGNALGDPNRTNQKLCKGETKCELYRPYRARNLILHLKQGVALG